MEGQIEMDLVQQEFKRRSEENKTTTEEKVEEKVEAVEQVVETTQVETEKQVEVVAETTETEEKTNTFFEKLDLIGKQPEGKTEAQVELSADVKAKLEEFEAIRSQLEIYKSNPLVKAMELGKDYKEIAKQIVGNDTSNLTFAQLVEAKMKKDFNLEGDELQEAVSDELSRLEGRSRFENARLEKELREEFSQSADVSELAKQLQEYENELKSKMPYQPTEAELAVQMEKVKNEDFQAIDKVATNLIDADIEGIKFTKEFVDSVKTNYNINELAPYIDPKTNELNSKQLLYDKFILANWQKIADAKAERAVKAAMKDVGNPDRNRGASPSATSVDAFVEMQKNWGMNTNQKVINID